MTESQLAQIVYERLCYYYEGARNSDQNLTAKKSVEFTLGATENSIDLTDLVTDEGDTIIEPLWCERLWFDYVGNNPVWVFVPTVNMDTLPERRYQQVTAVGYHGEIPTQITAEFSIYGNEAVNPNATFRIWYAPGNVFSSDKDATIAIPDNLTAMIVVDVKIQAFEQMKVEAGKYLDKRPELAARMAVWTGMQGQLQTQKAEWNKWWESFRRRSRSFHRATNHSDVLIDVGARSRHGFGRGGGNY